MGEQCHGGATAPFFELVVESVTPNSIPSGSFVAGSYDIKVVGSGFENLPSELILIVGGSKDDAANRIDTASTTHFFVVKSRDSNSITFTNEHDLNITRGWFPYFIVAPLSPPRQFLVDLEGYL